MSDMSRGQSHSEGASNEADDNAMQVQGHNALRAWAVSDKVAQVQAASAGGW